LAPHALPQAPQFAASLVTSTQLPLQQAWPSAQLAPPPHPQTPPEQSSPSAHRFPISPQFSVLVERFTHWNPVLP